MESIFNKMVEIIANRIRVHPEGHFIIGNLWAALECRDLLSEYSIEFVDWVEGCGYYKISGTDEWTEGNEVIATSTNELFKMFVEIKDTWG